MLIHGYTGNCITQFEKDKKYHIQYLFFIGEKGLNRDGANRKYKEEWVI